MVDVNEDRTEGLEDVTDLLLAYREAVRHLWKTYFAPRRDAELPWFFISIEYELFYSLVVWALGRPSEQAAVRGDFPFGTGWPETHNGFNFDPIPYLHVVPQIAPLGTPVVWRLPTTKGIVCQEGSLHTDAIDLRFVCFEDTSVDEFSDWRDYRARVLSYPADPSKEGLDLEIPVYYARIFFEDLTLAEPDETP